MELSGVANNFLKENSDDGTVHNTINAEGNLKILAAKERKKRKGLKG
jgi:hypothetical protein